MLLQLDFKAKIMVIYDPYNETDKYMTIPINFNSLTEFNELVSKEMIVPNKFHITFTKPDHFTAEYRILHVGVILSLVAAVDLSNITLGTSYTND